MYQILHAKWIITCEAQNRILENHALVIKDDKIHAILPSTEAKNNYPDADHKTFAEHALLPGFINCHTHLPMNIFRGLADDLDLMDWLQNHIWPAEGKWVDDEMVYDGTQLAIAEMLRSGSVCFNEMYFFPDATARAAKEAGFRAHIGMTIMSIPTKWAQDPAGYFAKAEEFYAEFKHDKLITPTVAPHSTYNVNIEDIEKAKKLADKYKLKMNIHLQEDPADIKHSMEKYNERPLKRMFDRGLLDNNIIGIHMTQVNDDDIQILLKTHPNIVHCPESNMKLAGGNCPVEKLSKLGINIALGTDGAASNNDLNMLGEMKAAAFLGKVVADTPKAVTAETALKMATINGAKALGIEKETGSLEVGKSADCIAINLMELETQPVYHPISQIVYAASRHQVTDVWIRGKQLLKNRQLTTMDLPELLIKAQKWRERIKSLS